MSETESAAVKSSARRKSLRSQGLVPLQSTLDSQGEKDQQTILLIFWEGWFCFSFFCLFVLFSMKTIVYFRVYSLSNTRGKRSQGAGERFWDFLGCVTFGWQTGMWPGLKSISGRQARVQPPLSKRGWQRLNWRPCIFILYKWWSWSCGLVKYVMKTRCFFPSQSKRLIK